MLSFFLEEDSSGSNRECFESYWSKAKRNPIIAPSSVRAESLIGYERVYYKYAFGQPHANFYFVNQGYCVDVHVSLSEEIHESEKVLSAIGESLKIVSSRWS